MFNSVAFSVENTKQIGDYNFDGYEDYRVFIMHNGRMTLWDYFLYDPKDKNYKKYDALTELWNPQFIKKDKKIITFAPGGHASLIFTSDTFLWKDGELLLIMSTKQDWDSKTGLYKNVLLKLDDGVMKVNAVLFLNESEAKAKSLEYFE